MEKCKPWVINAVVQMLFKLIHQLIVFFTCAIINISPNAFMQINIKYKTFRSLLNQFFKSENDLWPKCQAKIISAPFPCFSPHALFRGWVGSLKSFFISLKYLWP